MTQQETTHPDTDDGHQHHGIDYVEITAPDLATAKRFYTAAFGWEFTDYGPGYAGIRGLRDGAATEVGGLAQGEPPTAAGPLVLLYSTDLDGTVAAVRAAGGEILREPYAFPGGRRFHFSDPGGTELGVWSPV
ncbi:MAG: VOC family protein [Pseudonocardia sp.]|nr:VOC family protein [Pseudonocardia sp.]